MDTDFEDDWQHWVQMVNKTTGADWQDLSHLTEDGISIKPIYPLEAVAAHAVFTNPGWQMAQFVADDAAPQVLNKSILDELEASVSMIMLPLAVTSQMTADHMAEILDGVYTDACQFGHPHGGDVITYANIWADYACGAEYSGHDSNDLAVHLGADPVADIMLDLCGQDTAKDRAKALAAWGVERQSDLSSCRCFAASGDVYHRYGLTDGQELGLSLASLIWQLRLWEQAGYSLAEALPKSVMRIAVTSDLYSALAKTRGARMLLRHLCSVIGVDKSKTANLMPSLHVFTSDRMMTRIEPMNNVLRHVTASLGAALGGAEIMTTLPHDWLTGSTDMSRRLARNIQLIMRDEARLDQVADPAHGAPSLEAISQAIAEKAWQVFQDIEARGGAMAAVTSGMVRDWAAAASASRQARMDDRDQAMLGINHHPQQASEMLPPLLIENGMMRGGMARPAQPWEDLRQTAAAKDMRCLILDHGDSDKAHISRWLDDMRMAGIQAAHVSVADAETAEAQILAAKPHLLIADPAAQSMLSGHSQDIGALAVIPLDAKGVTRRQGIMAVIERMAG